jgi:serine protease Do
MSSRPQPRRIALWLLLVSGVSLTLGMATAQVGRPVGWLGISIAEVGEELSDRLAGTFGYAVGTGVYVADVLKDGPAERGELRRGDVIVRIDAQPIWDVRQLQRLIRAHPVDQPVTLVVLREGARLRLPVVIGAMPAEARAQLAGERFGFLVREERQRRPEEGGFTPTGRLLVGVVEPDSAAARAGLLPQDVILEVGRESVRDLEAFEQFLGRAERRLSLLVERRNTPAPLRLTLELRSR